MMNIFSSSGQKRTDASVLTCTLVRVSVVPICIGSRKVFKLLGRVRFDSLGTLIPISRANLTVFILLGSAS
jgi:hypothetical protein